MLSIIGLIPTILTTLTGLGTTASSISKNITDLKMKQVEATSNTERAKLEAEIQSLQFKKDVLVANAGNRMFTIATFALALGPISYVLKYYLWDKVIASFVGCNGQAAKLIEGCQSYATDPISPEMAVAMTAVIGFFLLYGGLKK